MNTVQLCVRCARPEADHPVGSYTRGQDATYCVHFDPPAPGWMLQLNRLLGGRR